MCAGNTKCKVRILLFTDLVTVTKLPANLSQLVKNTRVQSVEGVIIHLKVVSQNT